MNEEPESEAYVGVISAPGLVSAEFEDGFHALPEWIVLELGGIDEVMKLGEVFKQTTFATMLDALHTVKAERYVNRLQNDIISRHFGNGIPGPFTPQ